MDPSVRPGQTIGGRNCPLLDDHPRARCSVSSGRGRATALTLACLLLPLLGGWGPPGAGLPADTLACHARPDLLHGPCEFLDSVNVLMGPADGDITLVANFGLLRRDPAGALRYGCEEALGGLAWRSRLGLRGDLLVAGAHGVLVHGGGGACRDQPTLVPLQGLDVVDLVVQPDGAGGGRIWALTSTPPAVHISEDGGRSFTPSFAFAAGEQPLKLMLAPGQSNVLYVAGDDQPEGLLLMRSADGGRSFTRPAGGQRPPGIPLDLLGVSAGDPDSLFVAMRARAPDGLGGHDELWRSRDGGRTWQRRLALPESEGLGGFAFSGAATIYLAVREQLFGAAPAPARLFVSNDAGETWQPPIPSGGSGPRYRCLATRGPLLYACAGGEPNGDSFLLGVSSDGGRSWSPVMKVEELAGAEPCLRGSCTVTTEWLCATYGRCEGRPTFDAGAFGDAAAPENGTEPGPGGCGCRLAASPASLPGSSPASACLPLLLAGALAVAARKRRRSCARRG